jgi:RNA polymerase sigma-70 factor (family 1)
MDLIEDELLHSIKFDDKRSFEQIYRQYWSKLYIYAFNVLRERELCEDILQDVFIDLWAKRHDVQISDLQSYLYQSVKYQIFNHFRESKYKKQLLMKFDLISTQYKIDELYEQKEFKAQIKEVISQLPEQRRMIFEMSRYEGLSNKEISKHLSISIQTVKNQISESLKFIRKSLNSLSLLFF